MAKKKIAPKKSVPKVKKTTTAKKSASKAIPTKEYFLKLTANHDNIVESHGPSLPEAILELMPAFQIKTKAILTVKYGDKVYERQYYARELQRAFINMDDAIFLAKKITICLN